MPFSASDGGNNNRASLQKQQQLAALCIRYQKLYCRKVAQKRNHKKARKAQQHPYRVFRAFCDKTILA
jgi:hypothetical protein